ncbi:MAG TPA: hypothetical protein PKD75_06890 [Tepidiformaceae bacterium]|nr:hypothetical protein [Tepidiformaceae bacterium]
MTRSPILAGDGRPRARRVHAPAWFRDPEAELQRILERYRATVS